MRPSPYLCSSRAPFNDENSQLTTRGTDGGSRCYARRGTEREELALERASVSEGDGAGNAGNHCAGNAGNDRAENVFPPFQPV